MSGHGHHDAGADLHAAHDDHHEHHETSSDDFPADEPRSPGWLPLLGGALFLAAIFAFVVFSSSDDKDGSKDAPVVAAPAVQAAPRPASAIRPNLPLPPGHDQLVHAAQ